MPIALVKYPLDLTGENPGNKITGEPKVLNTSRTRVICANYGAYFTESMVVTDASTGVPLVKGVDWYPGWLYQMATEQTGKEVCALIVITNPDVNLNVSLDYQVLGGEYSYSYDAIVQMIQALGLDDRPVEWGNIINKPPAFTPAPHLHDVGDVYGWEYVVQAIQNLTQAIALGSAASEKTFYTYVDNAIHVLELAIAAVAASSGSKAGIIATLGYIPVDPAHPDFTGPANFNNGLNINRYVKEKIQTINATTTQTVIDLSLATIFFVNLSENTTFTFDMSGITDLQPNQALSFTMVVVNAVANKAISFGTPVQWAGKTMPPRTVALNGRDEYYFSTFNSGNFFTGSLSDQDVG